MKMIDQKNPRPSAVGSLPYASLERLSAQRGQAAASRVPKTTDTRRSQSETRRSTPESYRNPGAV